MMRPFFITAICSTWTALAFAQHRHCLGPGDLSADHVVDLIDHTFFANCLTGPDSEIKPECAPEHVSSADLDLDGDVDLRDVAKFALAIGNEYFDYGPYREDKLAEHLTFYLVPASLRAPDEEYKRIHRDLKAIHSGFPDTQDVRDEQGIQDNGLMVKLLSNSSSGFENLNEHYLVVSIQQDPWYPNTHVLQFCDSINATALSPIYSDLPEVKWATPTGGVFCIPECCPPWIEVTRQQETFTYEFFYLYDPENPCDCWRLRKFEIDNEGNLSQVSCVDACLPECP